MVHDMNVMQRGCITCDVHEIIWTITVYKVLSAKLLKMRDDNNDFKLLVVLWSSLRAMCLAIYIITHNTYTYIVNFLRTHSHAQRNTHPCMHTAGCRQKGISTLAFNSHIHIVAFNRECIALGHKPQALGRDGDSCV